jgi:hypothetical protein
MDRVRLSENTVEDLLISIVSVPAWLLMLSNLASLGGMVVVWQIQRRAAAREATRLQEAHAREVRQMRRDRNEEIDRKKRMYDEKRTHFEKFRLTLDDHRKKQRTSAFTKASVSEFLDVVHDLTESPGDIEALATKYHSVVDSIGARREANTLHFEQMQFETEGLILVAGHRLHSLLLELNRQIKKDFEMTETLLAALTQPDPDFFDPSFTEDIVGQQQALDERAEGLADLYQNIMVEMREELNAV